jgi:putative phosphoribosyl transferase
MAVMFKDRGDAGLRLCPRLKLFINKKDCVCVGLTRGGVITAKIISIFLQIPLKLLVVKKIGIPGNDELAIGATTSLDVVYWDLKILEKLNISEEEKHKLSLEKIKEVKKLEKTLGIKKEKDQFKDKTIILIDDGVATGATVVAALMYFKKQKINKIILAIPVIAKDTYIELKKYFDKIVALKIINDFYSVGQFYRNFRQVTDKEVIAIIRQT